MQKDILAYLSDINGYNDNEVNTQTEITAESIKAAFDKAE